MVSDVAQEKQRVLREVQLGSRVAEDEADELASYFVETEQWRKVWSGDVDVVYGPKGSGKSAIYSTLVARENDLFDRSILIAPAVNPRGSGAFEGLVEDPPTSEVEFVGLWKLYFILLAADKLEEYSLAGEPASRLIRILTEAKLRPPGKRNLRSTLLLARDYVRRVLRPSQIEPAVEVDSVTGNVSFSTRIRFEEPSVAERSAGAVQVNDLFELADAALQEVDCSLWILLDRLDVAFEGSSELEANALRALFRAYLDLTPFRRVELKIFLRTDIWQAIAREGFREASHITRDLTLLWERASLLRLVVQRLLQSTSVRGYYGVDGQTVLSSISNQQRFIDFVYPLQVETGEKKSRTFDWCLRRTRDGTGETAPRELIHLLTAARDTQIKLLELGTAPPPDRLLFSPVALKGALPPVSEARLTRTMYAEFPELKRYMEMLRGEKTNHNAGSLAGIWEEAEDVARENAERLVEVGFFERRKSESGQVLYWVPFLYRPALSMSQGSADGVAPVPRDEDEDTE